MALLKINGRTHYFNCQEIAVEKKASGRYVVTFDRDTFEIMGGRESGGAANEWFCYCPRLYGDRWIDAKSMVEAIKLGAQY